MRMNVKEKALVTGGGGFLGKAVVRRLLSKGYAVASFSRSRYAALDSLGVSQIEGDIADFDSVREAAAGRDVVFHVAAKAGVWGDRHAFYSANVRGTENVVRACRQCRVNRLVHTSSPSVVFNGRDVEGADETLPYPAGYDAHYPETKAAAEKTVLGASDDRLKTVILRPHLIWGPEDNHLVPGIIQRGHRLKKIGRTDDLVDTVYIDNAADAHVLAAEKLKENPALSGRVYFISQDEPVSKWYMANAFLAAAGLPPIKGHVSARTAFLAGSFFEGIYTLFRIRKEPPLTRFVARELATSHWFDISRAKSDLGYRPRVSIDQGLLKLKEWFEKQNETA